MEVVEAPIQYHSAGLLHSVFCTHITRRWIASNQLSGSQPGYILLELIRFSCIPLPTCSAQRNFTG